MKALNNTCFVRAIGEHSYMKNEEILKKLRDAKGFVSGQELCEYYGVSRTAIWKAIRQLE